MLSEFRSTGSCLLKSDGLVGWRSAMHVYFHLQAFDRPPRSPPVVLIIHCSIGFPWDQHSVMWTRWRFGHLQALRKGSLSKRRSNTKRTAVSVSGLNKDTQYNEFNNAMPRFIECRSWHAVRPFERGIEEEQWNTSTSIWWRRLKNRCVSIGTRIVALRVLHLQLKSRLLLTIYGSIIPDIYFCSRINGSQKVAINYARARHLLRS